MISTHFSPPRNRFCNHFPSKHIRRTDSMKRRSMYFIRENRLDCFPEFSIIRQTFDIQCLIIVKISLLQILTHLLRCFLKSVPVFLVSALIVSMAKISTGIYCLSKGFYHNGTIISTDAFLLNRRMLIQHHLNSSTKFRKSLIVSVHLSKTFPKC